MKFHSGYLIPRSRQDAARNTERFEIAIALGALVAIVVLLIGGARLLVDLLQVS